MTRPRYAVLAFALAVLALLSGGSRPLSWVALALAAWCLVGAATARIVGRGVRVAGRGGPHPVGTRPSRGHRAAGRRLPSQQDVPTPPRERR